MFRFCLSEQLRSEEAVATRILETVESGKTATKKTRLRVIQSFRQLLSLVLSYRLIFNIKKVFHNFHSQSFPPLFLFFKKSSRESPLDTPRRHTILEKQRDEKLRFSFFSRAFREFFVSRAFRSNFRFNWFFFICAQKVIKFLLHELFIEII